MNKFKVLLVLLIIILLIILVVKSSGSTKDDQEPLLDETYKSFENLGKWKDTSFCYPEIDSVVNLKGYKNAFVFPGGGIRGVIQATVLREIQNDIGTDNPLENHIALAGGTSTGALIATVLATDVEINFEKLVEVLRDENESGVVHYIDPIANLDPIKLETKSDVIYRLYELFGGIIFQPIALYDIKEPLSTVKRGAIKVINALTNATYISTKYTDKNISTILKHLLGNKTLNETNKPLVINGFDIDSAKGVLFRSYSLTETDSDGNRIKVPNSEYEVIKNSDEFTFVGSADRTLLWEAVRASTAAPTYFPTQHVHILDDDLKPKTSHETIDGGMFDNNITDMTAFELLKLYPDNNYLIVTIGNGSYTNDSNFTSNYSDSNTNIISYLKEIIYGTDKNILYKTNYTMKNLVDEYNSIATKLGKGKMYWININFDGRYLNGFSSMDNAKYAHIKELQRFGKVLYKDLDSKIKSTLLSALSM